jgi:bifunctional non-homologous end joining protein LigD
MATKSATPEVKVTHPERVLFPGKGKQAITKAELVEYYRRVAPHMLPHVKGRVISMQRFPEGIEGEGFYQKQAPDFYPDFVERVTVKTAKGEQEQVAINNAATLAYLANQGVITPHTWLSRTDKIDFPDQVIFDLDPPGSDFDQVKAAALAFRQFLEDDLGLTPYLKTTGSRGLHVMVPLDRKLNFDAVRDFASDIAGLMAGRYPKDFTTEFYKNRRKGRLFLDVARNAYAQTAVPAFAVRAKPGAPVATPLDWDELADKKLRSNTYNIRNLFDRLNEVGDVWGKLKPQSLVKARKKLDTIKR